MLEQQAPVGVALELEARAVVWVCAAPALAAARVPTAARCHRLLAAQVAQAAEVRPVLPPGAAARVAPRRVALALAEAPRPEVVQVVAAVGQQAGGAAPQEGEGEVRQEAAAPWALQVEVRFFWAAAAVVGAAGE